MECAPAMGWAPAIATSYALLNEQHCEWKFIGFNKQKTISLRFYLGILL